VKTPRLNRRDKTHFSGFPFLRANVRHENGRQFAIATHKPPTAPKDLCSGYPVPNDLDDTLETRVLLRTAIQAPLGYPWILDCMLNRSIKCWPRPKTLTIDRTGDRVVRISGNAARRFAKALWPPPHGGSLALACPISQPLYKRG
jgi:hypothetical protein